MSELEVVGFYQRLNRCNDLFDKLFRDKFFPEYEFKTGRPFVRNEYRGSGGLFTNGDEIRISMIIISDFEGYNLICRCNYGSINGNTYTVKKIHGSEQSTNFTLYVCENRESMYKFIREMYRDIYITDNYINKQKAYLFLLCNRKTNQFPRDIAKMIINKILFFISFIFFNKRNKIKKLKKKKEKIQNELCGG